MAVVFGFADFAENKKVDGHGRQVGLPAFDAADVNAQFVFPSPVYMTPSGRIDGEPLLSAMYYDPEEGWSEEKVYLDNPDLVIRNIDWENQIDVQLLIAEYKGHALYMAIKVQRVPV